MRPAACVVTIIAMAPCVPAACQEPKKPSLTRTLSQYASVSALDELTTEMALRRHGSREGNSILGQTATKRVALKALTATGATLLDLKLQRSGHRKAARVMRIVVMSAYVGVAARNVWISRRR